jgi:hypothetical protein
MDPKKKPSTYGTLLEGYSPGGAMSIYGSLKGCTRRFYPDVGCYCTQTVSPKQHTLPPEGQYIPMQQCASCETGIFKK